MYIYQNFQTNINANSCSKFNIYTIFCCVVVRPQKHSTLLRIPEFQARLHGLWLAPPCLCWVMYVTFIVHLTAFIEILSLTRLQGDVHGCMQAYFKEPLSGPAVPRVWNSNYFLELYSLCNKFKYYNFIACVVIVSALLYNSHN